MLTGENGLLTRASNSNSINAYSAAEEKVRLACTNVTAEIKAKSGSNKNYNATDAENVTSFANLVKTDLNAADSASTITEGFAVSADTANSKINITYKDSKLKKDSVKTNVPKEDGISEFIIEIEENGASVKTEADEITDLTGTTWTFNPSPNMEQGQYDVDLYVDMSLADFAADRFGLNINSWTQLVDNIPNILGAMGADNISSSIAVSGNNDSFRGYWNQIKCWNQNNNTSTILEYGNTDGENSTDYVRQLTNLPTSTGTCRFEFDGEKHEVSLEEMLYMTVRSIEMYNYYDGNIINEETYKYTMTITGGKDVQNQDLINWLKKNATYKGKADADLTGSTWTINPSTTMEDIKYNIDFYVDTTVADFTTNKYGMTINNWTELNYLIPEALESMGAENVVNNISIVDEKDNKFKIIWNNIESYHYSNGGN